MAVLSVTGVAASAVDWTVGHGVGWAVHVALASAAVSAAEMSAVVAVTASRLLMCKYWLCEKGSWHKCGAGVNSVAFIDVCPCI